MLRQQLRAIQDELGEKNPEKPGGRGASTIASPGRPAGRGAQGGRARAETPGTPAVRRARLPDHPDLPRVRPRATLATWAPTDILDLNHAQQVLDEDHFDLEKIKERILEHLAVLKLNPDAKAPILCFVGTAGRRQDLARPVDRPGAGPQVRAHEPGRPARRVRAARPSPHVHRRHARPDHPGHPPGRGQQPGADARRGGQARPRFPRRSDLGACWRSSIPAQNTTFRDNYLDMPFDLSKVFFIATANSLDVIPPPAARPDGGPAALGLQRGREAPDRRADTWSRGSATQAGLTPEQLTIPPEAIRRIIGRYTREAGVRELERMIGRVSRRIARRFAEGQTRAGRGRSRTTYRICSAPSGSSSSRRESPGAGRRDRTGLDRGRRRRPVRRGPAAPRRTRPAADRPARRRDAGIGAGGA